MKTTKQAIVIKRNLRIGDLEAETDRDLLLKCFIDNGSLSVIGDVNLPESIIVGRTGSGKSALLLALSNKAEKSRFMYPHDISVRFLEHSDIIQFFTNLGVKLDLFYRILWRHLITVELLKLHYDIRNPEQSEGVLASLGRLVERDPVKREALKYFREWGERFWVDTDERLKEITDKLTNDIKAGMQASLHGVDLTYEGAKRLSAEKRVEITRRASQVVNEIQIKKLSDLLDLLEDRVFDDRQKRYYILIDKLDEDWAETETRLRFIRALIEEIKTFRKLNNVKIVVALRQDLLDIVFDKTRDPGFQQEKYESYLLPLKWSRSDLETLVEKRINEVYRRQYTKDDVKFNDVFPSPKKGKDRDAMRYILDRTLLRPRDVMQFVNECFSAAFERDRISWRAINAAEGSYSQKRLNSLFEEWGDIYPSLEQYIELLRGLPEYFTRSTLSGDRLNKVISNLLIESNDPCVRAVKEYCEPGKRGVSEGDLVTEFLSCFYKIGAVGVKISTTDTFLWSDYDRAALSKSELKRVNQIRVNKMLHRALGIQNESTAIA